MDLDDEAPKKSKAKPKGKSSARKSKFGTSKKSAEADGGNAGSFAFLTAAEQREQDKKDDKKATESPYDFLQDVRDVGCQHFQFLLFSDLPIERWKKARGGRLRP